MKHSNHPLPNPAIKHFWLRKLPLQGQLVQQAQCMHCEIPATPRVTGEGVKARIILRFVRRNKTHNINSDQPLSSHTIYYPAPTPQSDSANATTMPHQSDWLTFQPGSHHAVNARQAQ